jgi:predicted nucleotidyltransferase
MRSNAGMANRQGDVDLRFVQVSAPSSHFGLAWPVLTHTSPPVEGGTNTEFQNVGF